MMRHVASSRGAALEMLGQQIVGERARVEFCCPSSGSSGERLVPGASGASSRRRRRRASNSGTDGKGEKSSTAEARQRGEEGAQARVHNGVGEAQEEAPASSQRLAAELASCTQRCVARARLRLALASIVIVALGQLAQVAECVDCFKCSSRNGSNPACEDPFHNLNSTRVISPILPEQQPNVIYHTPCYAGKKGRDGLFPASACIKLTGIFDTTGETLVVRHCALDSGTLTQDTELARMSHCGKFQFEGDLLRGCVLACPEDACNSALPRAMPTNSDTWLMHALLGPLGAAAALLALGRAQV